MTALYNVLNKERRGEDLDKNEREIHEKGLVGVLKELHDELDAAVARAYGWEPGLPEEEILQRLVDLNAERRAEEEEGHVRYVRPERTSVSEEVVLGCAPSTRPPRPSRRRPNSNSTSRSAATAPPSSPSTGRRASRPAPRSSERAHRDGQ